HDDVGGSLRGQLPAALAADTAVGPGDQGERGRRHGGTFDATGGYWETATIIPDDGASMVRIPPEVAPAPDVVRSLAGRRQRNANNLLVVAGVDTLIRERRVAPDDRPILPRLARRLDDLRPADLVITLPIEFRQNQLAGFVEHH